MDQQQPDQAPAKVTYPIPNATWFSAKESMPLLTVALAVVVFLGLATAGNHRRSKHTFTSRTLSVPAIIEVRDPHVARRIIIDHANTFSDHPAVPFPVDLDAGHPKTTSINSAPYGPLWRMLWRNLTADVLHPSRTASLAPVQLDAADALIAGLRSCARWGEHGAATGGGEAIVVVIRDVLYDAVFGLTVRLCFGNGAVGEPDLCVGDLETCEACALEARQRSRRSNDGGNSSYVDSLLDLHVLDDNGEPASGTRRDVPADAQCELRKDEIIRLVWEFLGAGTETVVASIEWMLAHLIVQTVVQKRLHREVASDNKGQVSDERLRLHPPVPFVQRDVVGDEGAAVGGTAPTPDGSPICFMFMAEDIGRDRKAWTDREEFRPKRFLAGGEGEDVMSPVPGLKEIKMMPFRTGRKHYPGAALAGAHVGCFVAALVRQFEWAPPADGVGVNLTATNALFLKVMASPLKAHMTPRVSRLLA